MHHAAQAACCCWHPECPKAFVRGVSNSSINRPNYSRNSSGSTWYHIVIPELIVRMDSYVVSPRQASEAQNDLDVVLLEKPCIQGMTSGPKKMHRHHFLFSRDVAIYYSCHQLDRCEPLFECILCKTTSCSLVSHRHDVSFQRFLHFTWMATLWHQHVSIKGSITVTAVCSKNR